MDATTASRDTGITEPVLEEITATIDRITLNRESRNGNPYTLIVTDTADWIYVWSDAWRRELRKQYAFYYEMDARLYVRDNGGPQSDDTRYDLAAVLPQSRRLLKRFLERWKQNGRHELLDTVEQCHSAVESP